MSLSIKIHMNSLGCAKNLVNSEQMLALLRQAGMEVVEDLAQADVAIVNTCGFIDAAKQEAIDTILETAQWKQQGQLKALIATGCLVERYQDEILQELPEQVVDASLNRYQLQLKRGDPDAARATLQKRLYAVVSQSITLLSALDSPAVLPEPERRLVLADAFRQMAATFGLLDSSGLLRVEPLLALGRVEDAAAALEEYVAVLTGPLPQPNPALFAPTLLMRDGAMSDDPDLGALRRMLRRQLLEEPAYAALRENPRAMAALERLGS